MDDRRLSYGRGRIIDSFKELGRTQEQTLQRASDIQTTPRITKEKKGEGLEGSDSVPQPCLGRGEFLSRLRTEISKTASDEASTSTTRTAIGHVSHPEFTKTRFKNEDIIKAPIDNISNKLERTRIDDDIAQVKRDSVGEYGEKTDFSTNYVHLETDPDKPVFQYEVTFTPGLESVSYRYRILYEHFAGKKDVLCYNGDSMLLTPERITDSVLNFNSNSPADGSQVVMKIKFQKKVKAKDCVSLYNLLLKNCSRALNLKRLKNKIYDPSSAVKIPQHKLEIWPGLVTSVEEFDGGVLLRCDTHHKLLRMDTAYDILTHAAKANPNNYKDQAEKELIGECVITKYNNATYRVDDIEWTKTPSSTFQLSNGCDMTFLQYYKKQYNIDILDENQPLLVHRAKNLSGERSKLICLVPELCYMTGLTEKLMSDIKVKKDIAKFIQVTPHQRMYAFKEFLKNIRSNEESQALLSRWGLTIADDVVHLKGRNLGTERIQFGDNKVWKLDNGQWSKELQSSSVFRSVDINHWLLLFPKNKSRLARCFLKMCLKVGPGLGIKIDEPMEVTLANDTTESYIQALKAHITEYTQIVVCIFSTQREDRYSAVKKYCCKNVPIPSQVVTATTLSREDRMRIVVQNIALQMNNKLGGASWSIHIPFRNTMVCGVDTYHDKFNTKNSVGGFVASVNDDHTEWFSRTNFQGPKQELIDGLIQSFIAALKYYLRVNDSLPERIIVFRDGVSDGQFQTVLNFEVEQFLEACRRCNSDYRPKFSFVIVKKRITTKFYMMGSSDRVENPRPGSIVDHTISTKNMFDFYLVSQWVRQGTATPCHYVVLYDNSNLKPDHIQRLTYKFCHMYYNWPGTVRVPAPCLYAHKLAYLVGQNIKTQPDERLENKLYYL